MRKYTFIQQNPNHAWLHTITNTNQDSLNYSGVLSKTIPQLRDGRTQEGSEIAPHEAAQNLLKAPSRLSQLSLARSKIEILHVVNEFLEPPLVFDSAE